MSSNIVGLKKKLTSDRKGGQWRQESEHNVLQRKWPQIGKENSGDKKANIMFYKESGLR